MMRRRRPMRWRDVPAGFRRLYRDPSNLAGIGIGLAAGAVTYVIGDRFVDYVMRPGMGVSSYSNLNAAMQYIRDGARVIEIAGSAFVAWKAGNHARDSVRGRFPRT